MYAIIALTSRAELVSNGKAISIASRNKFKALNEGLERFAHDTRQKPRAIC